MADESGSKFGTYANVFQKPNYMGSTLPYGTTEYASLTSTSAGSWDKKIRSIYTGEQTWAEFYDKPNYAGNVFRLGPNSTLCDLAQQKFDGVEFLNKIASYRMFASRPENWPGSSVADRRELTLSDLQLTSPNGIVKTLAFKAVGMIPTVGGVLESILDIAFPAKKKYDDPWLDLQRWVAKLLTDIVADLAGHIKDNQILGLRELIKECASSPSEQRFQLLYSRVLELQQSFVRPVDAASCLPQITLFGTIALAIHRVACFSYDEIYTATPTDQDRETKRANLIEAIQAFRATLDQGLSTALERRRNLIRIVHHENGLGVFSGYYNVVDDYTHWIEECKYSQHGERDRQRERADLSAGIQGDYASKTFDAEFDLFREIANLWSWYSVAPGQVKPATKPVALQFGMYGGRTTMFDWEQSRNETRKNYFAEMPIVCEPGRRFARIKIFANADVILGIQATFDDGKTRGIGLDSSKSETIDIAEDERITAIFGAWDSSLRNVTVRVEKRDKDGNPATWPRHIGSNCGKWGGISFAMSGPDGGEATLTRIIGQTNKKGEIVAIGTVWTRDRYLPCPA